MGPATRSVHCRARPRLTGRAPHSRAPHSRAPHSFVIAAPLLFSLLAFNAFNAYALPTGAQVSFGAGAVTPGTGSNGTAMTVRQDTQYMSINWQGFGINSGEAVTFVQPNTSAIALNRVMGGDPSLIFGQLTANGQVWLINPNGILFGGGAQVNVGGLVASTLGIADTDIPAGRRTFTGTGGTGGSNGPVANFGTLNANEGGYIALLGGRVSNEGVIQARLGTVALGAGNQITLDFVGDRLMGLEINQGTLNALVENKQLIRADGGQVLMTAQGADAVLDAVVNNQGIVEARAIDASSGTIRLVGAKNGGSVNVAGTLDASAPSGGNGGFIDTSGFRVRIADDASITAAAANGRDGRWIIDPNNFTVAANGGDITGTALADRLGRSSVTILSSQGSTSGQGDIRVNDRVTWNSANSLTLSAVHDVRVARPITSNGSGGVTLRADNGGACTAGANNCGTVSFVGQGHVTVSGGDVNIYTNPKSSNARADANGNGGNGPSYATPTDFSNNVTLRNGSVLNAWMLVNDVNQLQAIRTKLNGDYALGRDIDATTTASWNGGAGFVPVGNTDSPFTGRFDGLNQKISTLTINRPTQNDVGLFGVTQGAKLANVGLIDQRISGQARVGGLVGQLNESDLSNSYSTGAVNGNGEVGGLVGQNALGTITASYNSGPVTSRADSLGTVGGVVGTSDGVVSLSHNTGNVRGGGPAGGVAGQNAGRVERSYNTGSVSGGSGVGGLVGQDFPGGSVSNSFSTGTVSGNRAVGGLVGSHFLGTVSSSYATGSVRGTDTGSTALGGLIGLRASGSVANSYWNTQTSGMSVGVGEGSAAGVTGLTTSQMQQQSNFIGFDFLDVWSIVEGSSFPFLR